MSNIFELIKTVFLSILHTAARVLCRAAGKSSNVSPQKTRRAENLILNAQFDFTSIYQSSTSEFNKTRNRNLLIY